MAILETIPGLTDDDRHLIRILLANTSLQVQFNGVMTAPFQSTIGSPQGDGLSPLLFAIYLEAALREFRARGPQRPEIDVTLGLPEYAIYADDTDFISTCSVYLDLVQQTVGPIFAEFNLLVNVDKTERNRIGHSDMGVNHKEWKGTRKLGSLLGVEEDVNKRIQLAMACFRSLDYVWKHGSHVAEHVRIQAYRAIVESVLLYNCGTWALPVTVADRLDRAQRKMMRRVLGLQWYDMVTNADLYARTGIRPASEQVVYARWRLFGHTLRLDEKTPAREAMLYYFEKGPYNGRSGNPLNVATALSNEYESVKKGPIKSRSEFDAIHTCAQDRDAWKQLTSDVVAKFIEYQEAKALKLTEARKAKANDCSV